MTASPRSRVLLPLMAIVLVTLACSAGDIAAALTTPTLAPVAPTSAPQQATEVPVTPTPAVTATPLPLEGSISGLEMAASLSTAAPLPFDPYTWGLGIGLLDADTDRTLASGPDWEVGDAETFNLKIADAATLPLYGIDTLSGREATIDSVDVRAELRLITDTFYVWVDEAISADVPDFRLQAAVDSFETLGYEAVQSLGGGEWNPGMDAAPLLHLVYISDLGADAQFRRVDEYPVAIYQPSAEREVLFIDVEDPNLLNPENVEAALAREYWRMAQFEADPNEPRWSLEGMSRVVAGIAGFEADNEAAAFASASDTRLNWWPTEGKGRPLASSGAGYLYHRYVQERAAAGETGATPTAEAALDALSQVASSELDGLAAFDGVVGAASGDQLFFDWTVANLIDDPQVEDGQYGYADTEIPGLCPVVPLDVLPKAGTYQIDPYSAAYYELQGGTTLSLDFAAPPDSPLLGSPPFSGGVAWWSGNAEWSESRLTRALDLTDVAAATLDFAVWYDIDPEQGAAYVMVSTDDGETWTPLQGPHSVAVRNLPAFTGISGGGLQPTWVQERVDLTPYAGQEILLRFDYVSLGYGGSGIMVDNISIPELGFIDGAEALEENWEAEGWLRTSSQVSNRWGLFVVTEQTTGGQVVHTVTPVPVDEEGHATTTQSLPADVSRSWVVVALAVPGTNDPVEYTLTLDGDFEVVSLPELPGGALAAENFEASCGLFSAMRDDEFADTIADGALNVEVSAENWEHVALIDGSYEDVVVSADTVLPAGPPSETAWGMICRYFDADNYYGFQIRADGQYRIYVVANGEESDLVEFTDADVIETGSRAENNVLAACVGDTLSLTVNGEAVNTVEDSRIVGGQVGVTVASGDTAPVSVQFDNFLVTGPTGVTAVATTPAPGQPTATPSGTQEAICDCSANLYDCRDFPGRGEAQACYNFCGGRSNDVHLLDADRNGVVCETVFP